MTEFFAIRILYMEDDPGLARLLQKNLTRRGYVVDVAPNGEEGLAMMERGPYNILLLDYNMPFCGGLDVIRMLLKAGPLPPTIMVTAEGNVEVAVEALKLGATDYVVKDSEMRYLDLLPSVIDQVLDKQRLLREKQQMLEVVRESESRYRHLFEMNPLPMWVVDSETRRFLEVNQAAVEHYGWTREEFLGMTTADLAAPPLPGAAAGAPSTVPRHRRKKGDVIEVEIISHAMNFGDRRAEVVLANDVTERKRREDERIRAQKLESLGVLAGGLAHDFNNILTAILGNISLAKMDAAEDGKLFNRLEEAEKASLRARELAYQLLTFSKGGAPVKKRIDPAPVIREAAELALRGARSRPEVRAEAGKFFVEADEGQLRQVIHNIVVNADQAMAAGGVVTLSMEDGEIESAPGDAAGPVPCAVITIADRGQGIAPEIRDRIFDPYFTTKKLAGGMGLATAYSIMKRHDGRITVDSEPGRGAAFHLYLPVAAPAPAAEPAPASPIGAKQRRILVMDDEAMIRDVVGVMLRTFGYDVDFAEDGAQAIERWQAARRAQTPFDLVIMDLTIPGGLGGKDTLAKLREFDPAVKALVSSGYSNDPIMAEYAVHGFCGVVPKPYTVQRLRDAIQDALDGA